MASDYQELVPRPVADQVIQSVTEQESAVMQLARRLVMPSGVETIAVVASAPASGFVNPTYGGLKPTGDVIFDPLPLTAEELATVVPIPNAFIEDTSFPVWGAIQGEVTRSFARVFDAAALTGVNAPASWPDGGLCDPSIATPVSGSDALDALNAAFEELEATGVEVDGVLGGSALSAAIRKAMSTLVVYPAGPEASTLWGVPVVISSNWPASAGLALVGGWQQGVVCGVRQDVRFELSQEAVITDGAGKVIVNAWQADSTIMRGYLRAGIAAAHPIGVSGSPVNPLALAKIGAASATKAKS